MGEVVDHLLEAKDLIVDGWVPHAPGWLAAPVMARGSRDEHCALTALREVVSWRSEMIFLDAIDLLREAAGVTRRATLADWSDAGPKQKVIDGFDAAIRLAKDRGL